MRGKKTREGGQSIQFNRVKNRQGALQKPAGVGLGLRTHTPPQTWLLAM